MARGRYRRHYPHFKFQLCTDIRTVVMGRRETQGTYKLPANLIQTWLAQYGAGEMTAADIESSMINEHEAKIAALERKAGQLTMEIESLKKGPGPDACELSDDIGSAWYRSAEHGSPVTRSTAKPKWPLRGRFGLAERVGDSRTHRFDKTRQRFGHLRAA